MRIAQLPLGRPKKEEVNKKRFEKEFKKIYGYEPPQQAL